MSSWVISHVEMGLLSGVSENVSVSRQGWVTYCPLYLHPHSMLTAVPARTTGAGHHDHLTQPNVHSAVCTETANSILCGYNKICSYVIITSTLDDGETVSEKLGINSIFKQLTVCEDFTACNYCESFKLYTTITFTFSTTSASSYIQQYLVLSLI
jgi:hypothetical protein